MNNFTSNFTSNATTPADGDWMVPSGNGISNHSWTKSNMGGSSLAITNDTIIIGFFVATGSSALINFIGQRWWVFKK